jgi:hypothetical protein
MSSIPFICHPGSLPHLNLRTRSKQFGRRVNAVLGPLWGDGSLPSPLSLSRDTSPSQSAQSSKPLLPLWEADLEFNPWHQSNQRNLPRPNLHKISRKALAPLGGG